MSSKITQSNLDLVSVGCVDTIADTLDVAVAAHKRLQTDFGTS